MTDGAFTAWISWLRVFAIGGVVTIHTVARTASISDARDTLRGQLAIALDLGAIFAVPVFVMLSGAIMLDPARYTTPGRFLRQRAARLVPPVVFWHAWYVGVLLVYLDRDLSAHDITGQILNGTLYPALYFFWIVLGLSVVAPVLIPFVRDAGRRGVLLAGAVGALMTAAMMSTYQLRGATLVFTDSALTWWIPYLGVFLLGYALRGVVLRGWVLAATTAATIGLGALTAWEWRNPDAPEWLLKLAPVSYYGGPVIVYCCLIFLVFQGLIRPDGLLRVLTRPTAVRLGRLLGDATLGVFALHLTLLLVIQRHGWIGGTAKASPTSHDLVLRMAAVLPATYAIVLVLRRLPYVRSLL